MHNPFLTEHRSIVSGTGRQVYPRPGGTTGEEKSCHVAREIATLAFDDLAVGDEWESPRRTITETDVVNFAGLSGDFNPIHVDHELARRGPFRKPIAHGLLGLAVASGLSSHAPRVDTLAFLAILDWKFLQPIAFGDTIRVITRVQALEPRAAGPPRGGHLAQADRQPGRRRPSRRG